MNHRFIVRFTDVVDRLNSMVWEEQDDPSVAADFLERVAEEVGPVSVDVHGVWWLEQVPAGLAEFYGVRLGSGQAHGLLKQMKEFRQRGTVQGKGERLTLTGRESDVWLAAAFLLDRVEGVSLARDGTVLLDSPYAGGSTARARNFAEQFGLTVTLNDDPRVRAKWELRRPRVGLMRDVGREVRDALDHYRTPWKEVPVPTRKEVDTVIVGRREAAEGFVRDGGHAIVAAGSPLTIESRYRLTAATAKVLVRDVYLGSAREL